jgi:hypothetical protein
MQLEELVISLGIGQHMVALSAWRDEFLRENAAALQAKDTECAAILAGHYAPAADGILRQSGATVIRRLTDAEIVALDSSSHPAAIRAKMLAQSEGVISESDQDFAALTGALDQLGIIAANRWTDLLAP